MLLSEKHVGCKTMQCLSFLAIRQNVYLQFIDPFPETFRCELNWSVLLIALVVDGALLVLCKHVYILRKKKRSRCCVYRLGWAGGVSMLVAVTRATTPTPDLP